MGRLMGSTDWELKTSIQILKKIYQISSEPIIFYIYVVVIMCKYKILD